MDVSASLTFLDWLCGRIPAAPAQCLTLTAIHPQRNRPSPSRHLPLGDAAALYDGVERLLRTNAEYGYGAYVGLATRRPGLTRWERGGAADLLTLPALAVDIDHRPEVALRALHRFSLPPSCIVASGAGLHAYWLLTTPLTGDWGRANRLLSALAARLGGDRVTAAHCFCMLRGIGE